MRAPIPTEYKGVRYDSKSEAIFARVIDLSPSRRIVGHPSGHLHPWDLLAEFQYCSKCKKFGHGLVEQFLFEYKPGEPTDTYYDNLWRMAVADPLCHGKICVVAYGSPWQPFDTRSTYAIRIVYHYNAPNLLYAHNCHRANDLFGVRESDVRSTRNYRFDLRGGGQQPRPTKMPTGGSARDMIDSHKQYPVV